MESYILVGVSIVLAAIEIALVIFIAIFTYFAYLTRKQIKDAAKEASEDYIRSEEVRAIIRKFANQETTSVNEREEK